MMRRVNHPKRWLCSLTLAVALAAGAVAPQAAVAQELDVETEARVEGFPTDVKVKNDSTALAWLFMIVLAVLAISPLLKDAKRTHLD